MSKIIDIITNKPVTHECEFERFYIGSRIKENRLYTDQQLEQLPDIDSSHVHFREWQIRRRSSARLIKYLINKKSHLKILEVGCGNGWLSAKMAMVQHFRITGIDINKTEIDQANHVFRAKFNVDFENQGMEDLPPGIKYDVILFAASIQYFPFIIQAITEAMLHLKPGGEIHILDSYLYRISEIEPARQRSSSYYQSIGCHEMNRFYFHHGIHLLRGFNYQYLYNPSNLINYFFRMNNPFPWIRIKS